MSEPTGGEGLFASLKALAATLVAMGKTRIELLSTEIAVEKARLLRQLVLVQLFLFFLMLAIVFGAWLVVASFEAHRIAILAALSIAFLLAAAVCVWLLVQSRRNATLPLADSLAELEEDLAHLKAASRHDRAQGS
ncbi:phage holin family protein [Thiobacter aerophilum]|uniref:Phage holin family protein n=1 Tax=Thiobacter aerophilum TaxID=3121275 RepID=A0ABV0EE71_9BURK